MILLTDFDQQLQGLSTGPNREPVHRLEFIMQIGQLQEKFC